MPCQKISPLRNLSQQVKSREWFYISTALPFLSGKQILFCLCGVVVQLELDPSLQYPLWEQVCSLLRTRSILHCLAAFKIVLIQVNEVKSDLSQIGCDFELIHKMIAGLVNRRADPFVLHFYFLLSVFQSSNQLELLPC